MTGLRRVTEGRFLRDYPVKYKLLTDSRELRRNGSVFDLSGVRDTRRASLEAGLHGSGSRVFLGDLGVILFLFMNNKLALLDRLCDAK